MKQKEEIKEKQSNSDCTVSGTSKLVISFPRWPYHTLTSCPTFPNNPTKKVQKDTNVDFYFLVQREKRHDNGYTVDLSSVLFLSRNDDASSREEKRRLKMKRLLLQEAIKILRGRKLVIVALHLLSSILSYFSAQNYKASHTLHTSQKNYDMKRCLTNI